MSSLSVRSKLQPIQATCMSGSHWAPEKPKLRSTRIDFCSWLLLTKDILEGGTGRKSGRAPLQNRDTVRFTDVFNLHHAWGWDGGRKRHAGHWDTFKDRVKVWTGL